MQAFLKERNFEIMNQRRLEKFKQVVARRQPDLTVILENVWDSHNVGAVLRSCDSVGIHEIFVLNTEKKLKQDFLVVGKRTSAGSSKWVDVHYFTDAHSCFQEIRKKYKTILGTHLSEHATSLYDLNLTGPVALLFGNEHSGLSEEALSYCDGNFIIPQIGMAESLNISVACALTVYEAYRQRKNEGFYDDQLKMSLEAREQLFNKYVERHEERLHPKRHFGNRNSTTHQ